MQPFLAIATLVAALGVVSINSETAYVLAPVQNHNRVQRVLSSSGWGWKPVRTITLALPSISRGWGWKKQSQGINIGLYGGLRIGPKQQQGWGWQPQKQQGWGWQPQKQQGWGWKPQKQQGWGWGHDDDDDDEDDYRSTGIAYDDIIADDLEGADSSEEESYDDASGSEESEEDDISAEYDYNPIDYRNALAYNPIDYRNALAYNPIY